MLPTEKLYWSADAPSLEFETRVEPFEVRASEWQGRPTLVVPRTTFYPEAGGQLGDRGTLVALGSEFAIVDTQIDEAGTIHHVLAPPFEDGSEADRKAVIAELTAQGASIRGSVDPSFRNDQTAHHTAQHMLSRALVDVASAETASARLGTTLATIDLAVASLGDADLARAEEIVNDFILADRIVRSHFPTAEALRSMPLRRPPKVDSNVRVIEVEGFDWSPCGGTHCTRTGQIGTVRIASVERYKGMMRVSFVAARRALAESRKKDALVASLAKTFSCGLGDVENAVAKLSREARGRATALDAVRKELATYLGNALLEAHPPHALGTTHIVVHRPGDDIVALRSLAAKLTSRSDVVAVCTADVVDGDGEKIAVLQRGATTAFDCAAFWKTVLAPLGAKGGGRPTNAEGRFPASLVVTGVF